ncbi:DMT family transporter [Corynebacterium breve]|uniref:DMT family transporter n=1 Tax=Corynebacterium breve TaxID=3049799 RepID=A0ABY8VGD6_9CORY|nr:DMT family transporter [Corynebacterium breve]WIM67703.1 DMT family transporter [Corynebacterium breve]
MNATIKTKTPLPVKPVGHGKAVLILALGTAFLAFTPIWVKASNMDPATQAFLRVSIGFLALLPFGIWEMKNKQSLPKKGIILSVIAGLFLGIDFTCWNYSIFYVGAGIAAILLNLQVIVVPMLTAIFDKYKIPPVFLILVPIMIVGVLLTGGVFEAAEATGPETIYGIKTSTLGTLLGLTSGICYSFYLYFSRKAGTTAPRKDLYVQPMMYTMAAQMVAPLIWAYTGSSRGGFDFKNGVLIDGQLPMVDPETTVGDPLTAMNWFHLICLAILGQAIAWTFVQWGSVWLDPTLSAGILLLSPVSSVVIAWPLFGEIPSVLQWIGIAMILGTVMYQNGIFDSLFGKKKKPDAGPPADTPSDQTLNS